jgi:hypothetical protein
MTIHGMSFDLLTTSDLPIVFCSLIIQNIPIIFKTFLSFFPIDHHGPPTKLMTYISAKIF